MQNLAQRFGKPLFFYLFFFLVFNANGQLISAKMEKDFREDARIKVAKVVQFVNTGVEKYEKTGPQAFVDYLGPSLSEIDKKFIIKELKGLPPLPQLKMVDHNVVFFHKNKIIAEFDSYDVAQGLYQNKDIDLFYDTSLSFQENFESWKKPSKKDSDNNASIFWNNLIIPQAEARMTNKAAIPLMIGVPIVAAILGYYIGKSANKPKVAENRTLLSDPSPSASGAGHAHGHGTDNLVGGGTPEPEGKSSAVSPGKATKPQASGAAVDKKPASGGSSGSGSSSPKPETSSASEHVDKLIAELESKYKGCKPKDRKCAQEIFCKSRGLLDDLDLKKFKLSEKEINAKRYRIITLRQERIKKAYSDMTDLAKDCSGSQASSTSPTTTASPTAPSAPTSQTSSKQSAIEISAPLNPVVNLGEVPKVPLTDEQIKEQLLYGKPAINNFSITSDNQKASDEYIAKLKGRAEKAGIKLSIDDKPYTYADLHKVEKLIAEEEKRLADTNTKKPPDGESGQIASQQGTPNKAPQRLGADKPPQDKPMNANNNPDNAPEKMQKLLYFFENPPTKTDKDEMPPPPPEA
jgi:hypothetical protein